MRIPVLICLIQVVASYKILVYNSRYAHSHSNFMGNVADTLAEAGNDVHSLIPVLSEERPGHPETTKSKMILVDGGKEAKEAHELIMGQHGDYLTTPYYDIFSTHFGGQAMGALFEQLCSQVLDRTDLIEQLKNEKYDVFMAENFDMCGMGLSYVIKPKSVITVSTTAIFALQYDEIGVPSALSYNPSTNSVVCKMLLHHPYTIKKQQKYLRFLHKEEITANVAYAFHNSEPLIDFATPTLNRVIPIGGLGAKAPKPLDKEWEEIMSRRSRAVLISFGSVAPSTSMPDDYKQSILKVVASFPDVNFIWKYEDLQDEFATKEASKLENLILSDWMPQNNLLNHENVSAFITHGGMGSCMEIAQRGVPGLFVPVFGDQPRNALMMEHAGFGKAISKFDIPNAEFVISNLKEILENKKYREAAKDVSRRIAKKPYTSRELLVKYTEFAAEFGPSRSLRPMSVDMSFIEYHNIDIILTAIVMVLVTMFVGLMSCKMFLTRFGFNRMKMKKD